MDMLLPVIKKNKTEVAVNTKMEVTIIHADMYLCTYCIIIIIILYCVISRAHQGHKANVQTPSDTCNYII